MSYSRHTLHLGQPLILKDLRRAYEGQIHLVLAPQAARRIAHSAEIIERIVTQGAVVYGVNTGFGLLANKSIAREDLDALQRNLVLSHACGEGPLLSDDVVRLIVVLMAASLAHGASGVRPQTIEALQKLLAAGVYPCIPSKGSVGASGDLAPLAHLTAVLLGIGEARVAGAIVPAPTALAHAGLEPLVLGPKEGLALLNGTQVSTALGLAGLFETE